MRRVAVLLAAGCLALAGCGGDDEELSATVTTSAPEAATTAAPTVATETAPTTTATPATSTPAETTTTPASTTEEDTGGTAAPSEEQAQEGGAGDEEAVRTPAKYQATDGGLSPRTVTVPAFLAVEIRITSGDGKPHLAQVKAPGARDTVALPGQPAIIQLKGLKAGDYPIAIDGKGAGTLRVSKDAGGP